MWRQPESSVRPPSRPEFVWQPSWPEPEPRPAQVQQAWPARKPVAQTEATPATPSPARGLPRMPFGTLRSSYFGPVADQVVIDTGQFDRFGVISPKTLHQRLNGRVEVENQAAGV